MEESRIIEIKEDILADNTNAANDFRKMLENQGTFFVDVMAALRKQARVLNPHLEIFETCARTGEGIPELAEWLAGCRKELLG